MYLYVKVFFRYVLLSLYHVRLRLIINFMYLPKLRIIRAIYIKLIVTLQGKWIIFYNSHKNDVDFNVAKILIDEIALTHKILFAYIHT